MNCQYCDSHCKKDGKQKDGTQKYRCVGCGKHQQEYYFYNACLNEKRKLISSLIEDKRGVREVAKELRVSPSTVTKLNRSQIKTSNSKLPLVPEDFNILDFALKRASVLQEIRSELKTSA